MRQAASIALLAAVLLGACGRKEDVPAGARVASGEALPAPAAVSGSVTGMPEPGVAQAPPAPVAGATPAGMDPATAEAPPLAVDIATASTAELPPDAAVDVLRQYFAALNARDFPAAHGVWSDAGRAGAQSLDVAAGFHGAQGISAQLGAPGPLEGSIGSPTVALPASIEVRQADGSLRRYAGSFTLTADGMDPAKRVWRIASAALEERAP